MQEMWKAEMKKPTERRGMGPEPRERSGLLQGGPCATLRVGQLVGSKVQVQERPKVAMGEEQARIHVMERKKMVGGLREHRSMK